MREKKVLYIGGFELPDKNAAAHRVVGIAKGLRQIGYRVVFLNSLKTDKRIGITKKRYYGFKCYEYRRENEIDYLVSGKTVLKMIKRTKPDVLIAYNYPALALNRIRRYCKKKGIKCYADVTEWYYATEGSYFFRIIKNFDTQFRMRYVQKQMDGVIAISRYLYNYYEKAVHTVMIPPTVDISDIKWSIVEEKNSNCTAFVYAGSPSLQKERIDLIVKAINRIGKKYPVRLNIVGITEEQYRNMYSRQEKIADYIKFWGRIEHQKALDIIKSADWSIILRENNSVVEAGFPTKLVESISCGTPVIANEFSNIKEFLTESNSITIQSVKDIYFALECSMEKKAKVDAAIFDYHNYISELEQVMDSGNV